jgi:hypothetical protein
MPGLVPGIHVLLYRWREGVDGRDKPGHDDLTTGAVSGGRGGVNSKAVLRPDSADLLVGRKLTAQRLSAGFREGSHFFRRELNDGLFLAKKLQQQPRDIILHVGGQGAGGFNRMFK